MMTKDQMDFLAVLSFAELTTLLCGLYYKDQTLMVSDATDIGVTMDMVHCEIHVRIYHTGI